jgi:hypothetical protein
MSTTESTSGVDLYWLPLGAGGHFVRWNGRIFEAIAARLQHRSRSDLYHAALEVHVENERFVIEQAPAWNTRDPNRGVVCEGPVGFRWLGRSKIFRYEVRRWRDGVIPDVTEAVASPRRLSDDPLQARPFSSSCPPFRRQRGDATSSEPAICGTRTRLFPGFLRAAATTRMRLHRLRADAHRDGMPASSWQRETRRKQPSDKRERTTPVVESAR